MAALAKGAQVAGVVLAAGFSRRLGRPKQTVMLAGEMLVERAARVAREAGLSPVLVVVNPELTDDYGFERRKLEALGCTVVVNADAAEGMAASIRCGVDALQGEALQGVVLMTCDQVAATSEHLRALCSEAEEVAASGYAGRTGVPAYFPRSWFGKLQALRGDQGARELLRGVRVVASEDLALDVDSEEDLRRAEDWVRHGTP